MNKTILKKYANLLIKSGLNVQPKQDVLIFANVEIYPFVEMLVKEAYKAKANYVRVIWADDEIYKAKINNAPLSVLKQFTGHDSAASCILSSSLFSITLGILDHNKS